jgi:hypothetical protein
MESKAKLAEKVTTKLTQAQDECFLLFPKKILVGTGIKWLLKISVKIPADIVLRNFKVSRELIKIL